MKEFSLYLFCCLAAIVMCGCNSSHKKTKIIVYTKLPVNAVLYIKNVSLLGEKEQIIDSVTVINNRDSLQLSVPADQEKLYKVIMKGSTRVTVNFINDAETVRAYLDYFANKYTVSGSSATESLRKFNDSQTLFTQKEFKVYSAPLDSLKQLHLQKEKLYNSLLTTYNARLADFFKRYIGYADTVKSPAAFLSVYKLIDFGEDYGAFKAFVLRNTARFPKYTAMAQVKKEAMDVIRVHEEDFNIGQVLPPVSLPDIEGQPFSTGALKGQYYLIDFWATYCPQCGAFKIAEKKLFDSGQTRVKLVSVALDDDKNIWQATIKKTRMDWTNLIDEKMWTGPAVNTLLFDSIPYNFLVAPNGKIINRAIKPDSLLKVISRLK